MKRAKVKNCVKGDSCGYTCISKAKVCRKVLRNDVQPLLDTRSIDLGWAKPKKEDRNNGNSHIIGKCSSPNLTEEQRKACYEKHYGDENPYNLDQSQMDKLRDKLKELREQKPKIGESKEKPEPKINPDKIYSKDEDEMAENMVSAGLVNNREQARRVMISISDYWAGEIPSLYKGPEDPDDPRVGYINRILDNGDYPAASGEQYMYVPRSALKKGKMNLNKITNMAGEEPDYDPEDGNVVVKVLNNSRGKDLGKLDPYGEGDSMVVAPAGGYKVVNKVRKKDKNGKVYTVYEVEEE
jgi:hypothetical protein